MPLAAKLLVTCRARKSLLIFRKCSAEESSIFGDLQKWNTKIFD